MGTGIYRFVRQPCEAPDVALAIPAFSTGVIITDFWRGRPPPLSLPIGQTMAAAPPLPAGAAYAPQWTFPLPYPGAFPGGPPPWPRPAYLGGPVPQLPGAIP